MNLRLRQAIDRFDLGAYLDEQFVDMRYAAGGEEYRLHCFAPNGCAGGDYKHKLYVNVEKKRWICFKCGYGTKDQPGTGFLIRFMADVEGLHPAVIRNRLLNMVEPTPEDDLNDLIRNMFTQMDGGLGAGEPEVKEPNPIRMPREFRRLEMGGRGVSSAPYRQYLKGRGLKEADGKQWDIRFCPTSYGQWTGRIIFPIIDGQGAYRSAVGRALKLNSRTEKWVNWPDADLAHFLWPMYMGGVNLSLHWHPQLLLVEGIFDVLAAMRMRPANMGVRCSFGKKISDRQVETLKQHKVENLILAWDPKEKPAMKNAAERLTDEGFGVSVFPYQRANWNRYDIGDGLCNSWVNKAFRDEILNPIPYESPEFLPWLIN
jgi:hypothetical protein